MSDSGKKLVSASSLDALSKAQESQKVSASVSKVGACTDVARSSTSSKDSDDKELDRADSLEDMIDETEDQKPKQTEKVLSSKSPEVSVASQSSVSSKSTASTKLSVTSKSSSDRKQPPAIAPKPKQRKKSSKGSEEESKIASSSSSDEVSSRSEDSLTVSKDEPKPKSSSESLPVTKPRKKELPQVPLKATGLEVSPEKLEKIKMVQEDSVFADKENSRYSPAEVRRASCGASKAKIIKLKNKKEKESAMRRAASMSDIGTEVGMCRAVIYWELLFQFIHPLMYI